MIVTRTSQLLLTVARWLDSYAGQDRAPDEDRIGVDWVRIAPFIFIHIASLAVFWVWWSWASVAVAVALYLLRMFAITGFYHRYFSHRTFKTSRAWQFIFAVLGGLSAQRGPLWWAAHHRHHHAHSDLDTDIHSPHRHGFLWSHMGWFASREHFPTDLNRVRDLARFPELRFLDRYDSFVPITLAISLFALGALLERTAPALGTNGTQMFIWGFCISTVALFHGTASINSLAHKLGRQRYLTGDQSRNSFLLSLVTLGEGWHNNHHYFAASTRQGFFWWEIDITYYVLLALSWFGIIHDLKPVPQHILNYPASVPKEEPV